MNTRCIAVSLLALPLLASLSPPDADASQPNYGIFYSFSAGTVAPASGQRPVKVRIDVGGRYYGKATARVRIQLPEALELVAGDTLRSGPIDQVSAPWTLELRPRKPGKWTVRGSMHVDFERWVDESEWDLVLRAGRDTVYGALSDRVRDQRQEQGQWYRYAGFEGLIPIEEPEPINASDLYPDRGGRRASVRYETTASCSCAVAPVDTVVFRVVVARDGRMVSAEWHEHWKYPQPSKAVVAAARQELDHWHFEAAEAKGRAVSDAISVFVLVHPDH